MNEDELTAAAARYLHCLCWAIPGRRVGSVGNRAATSFFAKTAERFGFAVETPFFDCLDWYGGRADIVAGSLPLNVRASPFSPGVRAWAPLATASTVEELEAAELTGKILLLRGQLAGEPLMPKNFPYYNPEPHRRIIALLEAKAPAAIVAATATGLAGNGPFPLFEDGDFTIPSVYMGEEHGAALARYVGGRVFLEIRAERRPARSCNVVARKGRLRPRLLVCAHIDAKDGTPGALDNAAGVTTLLLLAELLAAYEGALGIEIVALNGEDYYANPGEQLYLTANRGRLDEIFLVVNLDGLGYLHGLTAYSLYGCSPALAGTIRALFDARALMVEGAPWAQGDHSIFVLEGRPALAITSERLAEVCAIAHTPKDRPELVVPATLVMVAEALRDLLLALDTASLKRR